MPCNAVTQQTARAAVPTALILDNPTAIEALAGELAKLFGSEVKVAGDSQTRHFYADGAVVEVWRSGDIVVRQFRQRPIAQEQVVNLVNLVAGLLFQKQVRTLISRQARITGEQRASNGTLVLNVEI